jgi:Tfp pilus assembly protein PilF
MRTEHAPQGKPLEEILLAATLLTAVVAVWALPGCETAKPTVATGPGPVAVRPVTRTPLEPTQPTEAEAALIDAAIAVAEVGDYEQALANFRELLAENPTLTEAHLGMATVLEKSGDLDRAERSFARAATLERDNFDAQSGHGRVLMALNRYNDAVRAWHKALVVRPESVEANIGMAMAFLGLDQPQTALGFAERAVRNDPQSGPARLELARTYERLGRIDEAIRTYEIALELNEPDDVILGSLVKLFCTAKRYAEAANASEELVKIAPSPNAYERLGWARFRLGEYEKSMAAYRKGVELDPNHWPSLNGVGTNAMNKWLTSGKKDDDSRIEARRSFQKSIKVNPDQPKVIAILTQYRP